MNKKIKVAQKIKTSYEQKIGELNAVLNDDAEVTNLEKLQQKLSKYCRKKTELKNLMVAQENRIVKLKDKLNDAEKKDAAHMKTIEDLKQQLKEVQKMEKEMEISTSATSIQLDDEQVTFA